MPGQTDVAILERVLTDRDRPMSEEVARYLLGLGFREEDHARMKELAGRARAGRLAPGEDEEFESFLRVGHLLSLLKSKARRARGAGGPRTAR
jgi:hypothetical protein